MYVMYMNILPISCISATSCYSIMEAYHSEITSFKSHWIYEHTILQGVVVLILHTSWYLSFYIQGTNICWSMMRHGRHSLTTTKRRGALLRGRTSLSTSEHHTQLCSSYVMLFVATAGIILL